MVSSYTFWFAQNCMMAKWSLICYSGIWNPDRIGQHKVLLPTDQIYDKILETNKFSSLFVYNNKTPALVKGTTTTCTHDVSNYIGLTSILFYYTVSHKYDAYTVFISAQIKLVKTSRVQEFCYNLNLAQKETLKLSICES